MMETRNVKVTETGVKVDISDRKLGTVYKVPVEAFGWTIIQDFIYGGVFDEEDKKKVERAKELVTEYRNSAFIETIGMTGLLATLFNVPENKAIDKAIEYYNGLISRTGAIKYNKNNVLLIDPVEITDNGQLGYDPDLASYITPSIAFFD